MLLIKKFLFFIINSRKWKIIENIIKYYFAI